jgi:hypothetical protein
MGLKQYIYSTYSPLSSTHLWLRCSNIFNPPKKNSFGCAANRKSQRLISTPKYAVTTHKTVTSFIPNFRWDTKMLTTRSILPWRNLESRVDGVCRDERWAKQRDRPIAMLSLIFGSTNPHDFSSSQCDTDVPESKNNSVAFGLRVTRPWCQLTGSCPSAACQEWHLYQPTSRRPSVLHRTEIRETVALISAETCVQMTQWYARTWMWRERCSCRSYHLVFINRSTLSYPKTSPRFIATNTKILRLG